MMNRQAGNDAIDKLYRVHVHDLFSYALHLGFDRETCKDAIHDVFFKLCFDKTRLDEVRNIRFYLLRSLKNRLLDLYKLKKETSELPEDITADDLPFTVHVTIEDQLIQSEEENNLRANVEKMLQSLTDRQREIIYLRFSQGCEYEEIAQLMNISVHSCRKLSYKAISKLKDSPVPLALLLFLIS